MRIPALDANSGPAFTPRTPAKSSKNPVTANNFRAALTSPSGAKFSERPVGATPGQEAKRIAPYPTQASPSDAPSRDFDRTAKRRGPYATHSALEAPGVIERPCFDPLSLLAQAPAASEPARLPEPSPAWLSETIRRIAWGGDRKQGTARVELGAGPYAGSALQVEAQGGALHIELTAPPGVDAASLAQRIEARLEERGLAVASLRVR